MVSSEVIIVGEKGIWLEKGKETIKRNITIKYVHVDRYTFQKKFVKIPQKS